VLIIADEPTGNLDSHSGRDILNLLRTLHQQGVTIVMVTHDPITAEYTQRVIHLADGKIDRIKHNGNNGVDDSSRLEKTGDFSLLKNERIV
jgi:ABC-type lipoprotein export system ATPase subunit